MIHPDACPRCGSAPDNRPNLPPRQFLCGTVVNSDGVLQSDPCRLTQVMIERDQAICLVKQIVDDMDEVTDRDWRTGLDKVYVTITNKWHDTATEVVAADSERRRRMEREAS